MIVAPIQHPPEASLIPALHYLYTPDHEPMLLRFLSSLRDEVELFGEDLSQHFMQAGLPGGGQATWEYKTELLARLADPAQTDPDRLILMLDIDIEFFAPLVPVVEETLRQADICFQLEKTGLPDVNIGVIAFRPNETVARFWRDVNRRVRETGLWDQAAVNEVLFGEGRDAAAMRFAYLPQSVWCQTLGQWGPPRYGELVLHHANWHDRYYKNVPARSIEKKWLVLNEWKPLAGDNSVGDAAAATLVTAHLHNLDWEFGRLGNAETYGRMRFEPDGAIGLYNHDNEHSYRANGNGIAIISRWGSCTTFLDEFYYDRFRRRLLAIGKPPNIRTVEDVKHFHYITAGL